MFTPSKRWLRLTGGVIALAAQATLTPANVAASEMDAGCRSAILETERQLNIPNGLLMAMALVERGRDGEAWHYTLTFGLRTTYPETAEAAARQLRDEQGQLRRNLHVGCLQLSLRHHYAAFSPVERIIDPEANVRYAGNYLVQFLDQRSDRRRNDGRRNDWSAAVQRYNGGPAHRSSGYLCRVWRHLVEIDPDSAAVLRAEGCGHSRRVEISAAVRSAFQTNQIADGSD